LPGSIVEMKAHARLLDAIDEAAAGAVKPDTSIKVL
jgi:hypothetical protein